ncbi:hypothetical protein KP509_21G050300 [Ceratopteris richardii]|uniref:Glycosyltransferase n=1 Tax=Ceratopteris richardii TaxID=49495 RepID=A0A8T2SBN9_CERRI|nr:hypothetical protein KP509_21G050300 [Ceratopteris richardii]
MLSKIALDKLQHLNSELTTLREENIELKVHLKRAEQERDAALKQRESLGLVKKVGPVGTVKSLRTQPLVQPNEDANPKLAEILSKVAPDKELVVGIANNNVRSMVNIWFSSLKRAGVSNYLLVALDDQIAHFCKSNQVPFYRRDATIAAIQKDTGDNHAISGLKFHLLREFLELGYSVLLSDVDILFFQNPFLHLYRDCDVESMSDGYNNQTAYGYDDVSDDPKMGWARYAHTMRIWVFNSGLFYIRPTIPSIELLDRVTSRLSKEKAWDQAVFNEELFRPSHPGYEGLHASLRVMDYYLFMNSKVMFTIVRKDANFDGFLPVALHVNYHPDKYERMLALINYFVNGKKDALKAFPDGSEWR